MATFNVNGLMYYGEIAAGEHEFVLNDDDYGRVEVGCESGAIFITDTANGFATTNTIYLPAGGSVVLPFYYQPTIYIKATETTKIQVIAYLRN